MSPDSPPIAAESPDKSQLDRAPQSSIATTLERSSLESLPDEVLIDIIRNGDAENTNCMARSLCLVSKRMEPVARQELYRAISILTYRSLTSLCRILKEKPEFGQYMVELNLRVPSDLLQPSNISDPLIKAFDFEGLWLMYCKLLRRSAGLRKLTMMLVGHVNKRRSELSTCHRFIHRLSEAIRRSQHSGSIIAILPQLEQVRLISNAQLQHKYYKWDHLVIDPVVFKPFLHLYSLSSLECIKDSGAWGTLNPSIQPAGSPTNALVNAHHYEQIKSVVLRESASNATDIMDLVNMCPVLEVLFISQRLLGMSWRYNKKRAQRAIEIQRKADQFEKRYLSDSFEKLQNLNTLFFTLQGQDLDFTKDFLGPSNFLSLKKLCNLTSVSVLIDVFASPDGSTTAPLTVSPIEALPRSLRSLHIIVDHMSLPDLPFNEHRFQPRVAALGFMEQLASICSTEFPSLRQVEYIWAVTRLTDIQRRQSLVESRQYLESWRPQLDWITQELLDDLEERRLCDGSVLSCCDMHTIIQALSPDMDYTSKAEGIVSPFKDRFDSLEFAFKNVGVTFEVIELKEDSDFFFHWQQGRK